MRFSFNGISSDEMGLKIKKINNLSSPIRKYKEIDIYGRGKLHIDEGTYEDFTISVECLILGEDIVSKARRIKAWLQGEQGYKPLIVSNENDKVYSAIYKSNVDITEVAEKINNVLLNFECKVGYTSGANNLIVLKGAEVITNMGTIESEPYIKVIGSGLATLYINNTPINLDLNNVPYLEIDTELLNCSYNNENANHYMEGDFPIFPTGDIEIKWLGNIETVEILPRWRSL